MFFGSIAIYILSTVLGATLNISIATKSVEPGAAGCEAQTLSLVFSELS